MTQKKEYKECFGDHGGSILHSETPYECIDCGLFDKCYKITISSSLQAIASDLDLITQNGLKTGWLKCLNAFDSIEEKGEELN